MNIVSSLEARLIEGDRQMKEVEFGQPSIQSVVENKRNTQVTEVIRELKQQLAESKRSYIILKVSFVLLFPVTETLESGESNEPILIYP